MLRYKNSLLERLLLEKGLFLCVFSTFMHGYSNHVYLLPSCLFFLATTYNCDVLGVDVQAELRIKGNSSSGSGRVQATSSTNNASPMQRAMMNRQQHARTSSNVGTLSRQNTAPAGHSPTFHTTPSSHQSPPSTGKSPTAFVVQGGISPTASDLQAQQQMQPRPLQPNQSTTFINHQNPGGLQPQSRRSTAPGPLSQTYHNASSNVTGAGFYPTSFQKHYDQLGKFTPHPPWSYVRPRLIS